MKRNKKANVVWQIILFICTVGFAVTAAYFYGKTVYDMVKIGIWVSILSGTSVFAMSLGRVQNTYLFDNEENPQRFAVLYLLFLAGSVLFPLLPVSGWPYLAVFAGLLLFSNSMIAVCSGSALLLISVLLTESKSPEDFLVYFIAGLVGVFLFSCIDDKFHVGIPLFISAMMQFLCLCVREVLLVNEKLQWEMFLIPFSNILICLILLLIILKVFSHLIIYRNQDLYMDINDPECPLIIELKNFSKDEYYHAVHTAYLCDRIAKRLYLDEDATKAAGYYHKIGLIKGVNDWNNVGQILEENNFPEKVCEILKEYLDGKEAIVSKETVVLLFADTIISSICYLFAKDNKAKIDYDKLIPAIFKKKEESGILKHSNITLRELEEMKKILLEEKLYYDFLR